MAKGKPKSKRKPRLRPFSWWSLDVAEDLKLIAKLTNGTVRQKRDAFAVLIWAHLEENDPADVERIIAEGGADDAARDLKSRPESLLTLPDLPRLLSDFERLLDDERLSDVMEDDADPDPESADQDPPAGE